MFDSEEQRIAAALTNRKCRLRKDVESVKISQEEMDVRMQLPVGRHARHGEGKRNRAKTPRENMHEQWLNTPTMADHHCYNEDGALELIGAVLENAVKEIIQKSLRNIYLRFYYKYLDTHYVEYEAVLRVDILTEIKKNEYDIKETEAFIRECTDDYLDASPDWMIKKCRQKVKQKEYRYMMDTMRRCGIDKYTIQDYKRTALATR